MDFQIPDKLYFKIGEVASFTGVKTHVLRYWETEFKAIRPNKSRSNQRLYRKQDVELILRLKDLLYNQGFTIAGARKKLREKPVSKASSAPSAETEAAAPASRQIALPLAGELDTALLREIRKDVERLRKSLEEKP
jgi:DNA-binding transcriptional MerR regulator